MTPARLLILLALRGVPAHLRDSVQGDLTESQGGVGAAWAMSLHFQAEPYRASSDRCAALLLFVAAAGLLWIVPMAAYSLLAQAAVFGDGFSRAVLMVWSAPTALAAVVSGLLLGRSSALPRQAEAARLHMVLVLLPAAALAAPDALQAVLAAVLLPAAAWLAGQNREVSAQLSETA